jgi:hypothetical protein
MMTLTKMKIQKVELLDGAEKMIIRDPVRRPFLESTFKQQALIAMKTTIQ